MKLFATTALLLAVSIFSSAEDDGQYRPALYGGDDGQYHPGVHVKYGVKNVPVLSALPSLVVRNYAPYPELLAPVVHYGSDGIVDPVPFASTVAPYTYTTVRPVVYSSTAAPIRPLVISSTPAPISVISRTSAPIRPVVISSTPAPIPYAIYKSTSNEGQSKILSQTNDSTGNSYRYSYNTDNGIHAAESGVVDAAGHKGTAVSGFYEYIGNDGLKYRVDYTADENGFHPSGAHLP